MKNIKSSLNMEKLVFDKIEFRRLGFKTESELKLQIQSHISQKKDSEIYKVTLVLHGNKSGEYTFEISLTGFFTLECEENFSDEMKNTLISKNTVAIMMPYLRSQVSLLTAQPEVDCVVLPPLNINNMLDEQEDRG